MQRLRTVTSLDVSAVAGHHAMPAALIFLFNSPIPFTCTKANEYPFSNEICKKNGLIQGDCIAWDALFSIFLHETYSVTL